MHLKLGLVKNFVKGMNQEAAFTYLWEKFPKLSEAKLKKGIFIGPQIQVLIKDEYIDKILQGDEKAAWGSFKFVVKVLLGNRRAQNYELVNNLLQIPEIMLQHFTKITLPSLAFGFFPRELWCGKWWTWRTFPSRHFFNGEEMKGNGTVLCSPTTTGLWQGIPLPWNTIDRGKK